jgi:hypothetical protein
MMGLFDFMANDPASHDAMLLRQRIALQMMQGSRRGYPKTLGEGLTAVGDSIGEIGMARRLEAAQAGIDANSLRKAAAVRPAEAQIPVVPNPSPATPGPGAEATPTVQTSEALQPSGVQTAAADYAAYQPVDALPPVQDAGGAPQTASVDTGTMSDAPPMGAPTGQPNPAAVRASITQLVNAQRGGLQQNPMLAGQSPASLSVDPSSLGSPLGENRPIPTPIRLAEAGTKPAPPLPALPPDSQMPPAIPPTYAPARPPPEAPAEARVEPNSKLTGKPFVYQAPPPMPTMSPAHVGALNALRTETFPRDRAMYEQVIKEEEQKRAEQHTLNMENWKAKMELLKPQVEAEQAFRRGTPQRELELQKAEQERQQKKYDEVISRQIGGLSPSDYAATLKENKAVLSGIPSANDSIRRARKILNSDQLFVGTATADTEKFLSKALGSAGFPVDPKVSGTEQFKQAMSGILGQARKSIIGAGAQSDRELATLESAIASDVKLDPATIRAALDAAESLNFKLSHAHMQMVRPFAGETDPDRQRSVYTVYGAPDYINSIPDAAVQRLRENAQNPEAHKQFDNTFHMPGLSREVLRLRRP